MRVETNGPPSQPSWKRPLKRAGGYIPQHSLCDTDKISSQRYQKLRRELEIEVGGSAAPKESPKRKRVAKAETPKKKGKNAQGNDGNAKGKMIKDEDEEDAFGGGE